MNVLLIIGLVLAAILAIIYIWASAKCHPKTCLFTFIAAFVLILALIVALALPPKTDNMQISAVNGSNITLFDGRGNYTTLDISNVPHAKAEYTVGTTVQLTRDTLGNTIFLSPQDWTILPKNK